MFDFYLRVSGKLFNMNKHPFRLNANVYENNNIKAQREMFLNALMHAGTLRDNRRLRQRKFTVRNPGTFHILPEKAVREGYSDSRNPEMMRMFTLAGLAERSKSEIRIMRACREAMPLTEKNIDPSSVTFALETDRKSESPSDAIVSLIISNRKISRRSLVCRKHRRKGSQQTERRR